MAQGKKYSDEIKEKAIALLSCNNASFVAEELGLPYSTVKTWEMKALKQAKKDLEAKEASDGEGKGDDEVTKPTKRFTEQNLVELRQKKKEEFIESAWELINLSKGVLEKRLKRAMDNEEALDELVDEIMTLDYKTLTAQQRQALYMKLAKIKVDDVKSLATVLGTLYDKQALANKEATAIVEGSITVKKFEDF